MPFSENLKRAIELDDGTRTISSIARELGMDVKYLSKTLSKVRRGVLVDKPRKKRATPVSNQPKNHKESLLCQKW